MRTAVMRRLVAQVTGAIALSYGIAHAQAASERAHGIELVAVLVGVLATWAASDVLRRRRGASVHFARDAIGVLQTYLTYVLAYVLRLRFATLFGSAIVRLDAIAAPLVVVAIASTIGAVLTRLGLAHEFARHYGDLHLLDRFVSAFALSYGIDERTRASSASAARLFAYLVVVLGACAAVRRRILRQRSPPAPRYRTLVDVASRMVTFVEQYATFVAVRLVQERVIDGLTATLHVRALATLSLARLSHAALHELLDPFLMLVVFILIFTVYETIYYERSSAATPSRRFADRFLNAVAISSALVHSDIIARSPRLSSALATLVAALVAVYVLEDAMRERHPASSSSSSSSSVQRAPQRVARKFGAQLVVLVELYVSYATVRVATLRYARLGPHFSFGALARPCIAVVLLLVAQHALAVALDDYEKDKDKDAAATSKGAPASAETQHRLDTATTPDAGDGYDADESGEIGAELDLIELYEESGHGAGNASIINIDSSASADVATHHV